MGTQNLSALGSSYTSHTCDRTFLRQNIAQSVNELRQEYQQLLSTYCDPLEDETPPQCSNTQFEKAFEDLQRSSLQNLVQATMEADAFLCSRSNKISPTHVNTGIETACHADAADSGQSSDSSAA